MANNTGQGGAGGSGSGSALAIPITNTPPTTTPGNGTLWIDSSSGDLRYTDGVSNNQIDTNEGPVTDAFGINLPIDI